MSREIESANFIWRQRLIRVYLSGFVCLVIIYFGWRFLQLIPWFEFIENPILAGALAILAVIILPPVLGSLVQLVLNPILGKWSRWSELMSLEERLAGEIASERRDPKIVIVNWPSKTERTVGIMTSVFPATDHQPEMGAVYLANAPRSKAGYIRIIETSQLEITDWTLREFQMYQWTCGAVAPTALKRSDQRSENP